jgi:hypothetical protein
MTFLLFLAFFLPVSLSSCTLFPNAPGGATGGGPITSGANYILDYSCQMGTLGVLSTNMVSGHSNSICVSFIAPTTPSGTAQLNDFYYPLGTPSAAFTVWGRVYSYVPPATNGQSIVLSSPNPIAAPTAGVLLSAAGDNTLHFSNIGQSLTSGNKYAFCAETTDGSVNNAISGFVSLYVQGSILPGHVADYVWDNVFMNAVGHDYTTTTFDYNNYASISYYASFSDPVASGTE